MSAFDTFISRPSRRSVGLTAVMALFTGASSACTTAAVVYRPPSDVLAAEAGRWLELRTVSGERYTIRDGHVRNDTLFATRGVGDISDSTFAVPMSQVSSLTRRERQLSEGTSGVIGLVVGAVAGILVAAAVLLAGSA